MKHLKMVDPEIFEAIRAEVVRQITTLELIASENFTSRAVLEATGSVMTNKYAEGYPGKRYYGGCVNVDVAENLARERAKELFGADAANVQPHSGTQANMTAYFSVANPGDTLLGMNLSHGGHLSHGHPVNFSGRFFKVVQYGVSQATEQLDYDELRKVAQEARPRLIVAGASAYPRTLDFAAFRSIADEVGARLVVDMAHIAGLVAAGEHPSPVPFADIVTSTTHKTLRGPRGGLILMKQEFAKGINSQNFPGTQGGPLMHVIAAKAVCFKLAMTEEFRAYQKQVRRNAAAFAQAMAELGYHIVSGGTDTHLFLVSLIPKKLTGKVAEEALDKAGITVNKNTIPFDPEKPFIASGLRIGTPAVTTRGMKEPQMRHIAELIDRVLTHIDDESEMNTVKAKVRELCEAFPLYSDLLTSE
ncbi:serine hydroxymethyltransferase [Candidatus Fermentibacteria bacterium]|nr:serine hydroxymethyltransferase [Candidatus Fermentibacteria bacterium]